MSQDDQEQFKVGDVVRLKSGGPKMTVSFIEMYKSYSYNPTNTLHATCTFFDERGSGYLTVPFVCLKKTEECAQTTIDDIREQAIDECIKEVDVEMSFHSKDQEIDRLRNRLIVLKGMKNL